MIKNGKEEDEKGYQKEEENYYKPVKVNNFWSNNYLEYKSKTGKNRILSVKEYLNKIRSQLNAIINNLKRSDTWKIQLTRANNFISSKDDNDEERVMHSKSNNIEILISDEADEVVKKLIYSLKSNYQNDLESVRGGNFVFGYVHLMYYKYYKIKFNSGGSYMDSPDCIKDKKYPVTVALNYEE